MEPTDETKEAERVTRRERIDQMDRDIYEARKRAELALVRAMTTLATPNATIADLATALQALHATA